MSNGDTSEISIIYDIKKKNNFIEEDKNNINIFGLSFVENNKNICKIIIDNNEYEITEKYKIKNYNNNILEIKLKGINNVTDMRYMFDKCSSLSSLPDISKLNTNNVRNMKYMFSYCSSLSSLSDISVWNTCNVQDMSYMFYGCSSLSSLPDISKWDINNVTNMNNMFYGCNEIKFSDEIKLKFKL